MKFKLVIDDLLIDIFVSIELRAKLELIDWFWLSSW